MKTESEKQKFRWFIACLVVVALVINSLCFGTITAIKKTIQQGWQQKQAQLQRQRQERQQAQEQLQQQQQAREREQRIEEEREAAAHQAAIDAVAEHARYLARYLNPGFSRKTGVEAVAVAVASEDGAFNQAVTRALANHLNTGIVRTLPAFFKPEFVSDGLINDGLNDSSGLAEKLELTNSLDGLLLARESVDYSSNPSLENVLTATMRLEVTVSPVAAIAKSQTWTFTAAGAGFKKADARAQAEERIIKQIMTDTNMTVN